MSNLYQRLQTQQALDLDPVVQFLPINCKTAWFDGPFGALFGCGIGELFKPGQLVKMQAYFLAIAQDNMQ